MWSDLKYMHNTRSLAHLAFVLSHRTFNLKLQFLCKTCLSFKQLAPVFSSPLYIGRLQFSCKTNLSLMILLWYSFKHIPYPFTIVDNNECFDHCSSCMVSYHTRLPLEIEYNRRVMDHCTPCVAECIKQFLAIQLQHQ